MMKVIFLDIDGVLNSSAFFASNNKKVKEFNMLNSNKINDIDYLVDRQMMDIDYGKLFLLKKCVDRVGARIVITSSWKKLHIYPYIEQKLIALGIPVIGVTLDYGDDRGAGIKKYLKENNITEYVILDDDIFDDYDDELLSRLVKTSFYDGGFKKEHQKEVIKRLKRSKN